MSAQLLQCPICSDFLGVGATNADLNRHVDECLNLAFIENDSQPQPQPPPQPQPQPPLPQCLSRPPQPFIPNNSQPLPFASLPPPNLPNNPPPFHRPPKEEVVCDICGKEFQTFSQLFSHKGQEHPSNPGLLQPSEPPKPLRNSNWDFECPCCGERFESYDDFSNHMTSSPCKGMLFKSSEDDDLGASGGPDFPVLVPQELTGEYYSFTLHTTLEGECGICYEDFEVNQEVARLDCLCVYHKACISSWYRRSGEKRCPLHGEDFTGE